MQHWIIEYLPYTFLYEYNLRFLLLLLASKLVNYTITVLNSVLVVS